MSERVRFFRGLALACLIGLALIVGVLRACGAL
jgi:hypothetical protein